MVWNGLFGPRPARWAVALLVAVSVALSAISVAEAVRPSPAQRAEDAIAAGVIAREDGRRGDAERAFRTAAKLDPNNRDALYNYGLAQMDDGRLNTAERLYRRTLKLDPRFRPAILNLAIIVANERPHESVRLFRRLVELDRSDPRAHFNLGYLLLKTGEEAAGLRELRRAVEMDPTFEARRERAIAQVRQATEDHA